MMSSGQVVAITGGARGIGFATARRLTELGAHVAIGDVDDVAVKEAAATLGLRCAPELDVTERDSFAAFLDEVETTLGPIDVLINNAGIMPIGPLLGESDALARRIFEINVLGVITGTKLALARMLPRHRHLLRQQARRARLHRCRPDRTPGQRRQPVVGPTVVHQHRTRRRHLGGPRNRQRRTRGHRRGHRGHPTEADAAGAGQQGSRRAGAGPAVRPAPACRTGDACTRCREYVSRRCGPRRTTLLRAASPRTVTRE